MATNADYARVGVTGAAFVADLGTTLPTDLAAPGTGFVDLGYMSEDGLTESRTEDRAEFTPWQETTPIRTEITGATKTFSITCWETNAAVVSLYYQTPTTDMTETTGVVSFDEQGRPAPDPRVFIFDVFDGDRQRRFICPRAEVTARGDIQYAAGNIVGYPLTISAYPGSDGVSIRRIFDEGWALPVVV